jgi:hypothetical protein
VLNWSTASETNNSHFEVERSENGLSFIKVGEKIPAHGNSNVMNTYGYVDLEPNKGINYYRLKQVDFNGDFKYSNILSINNQNSKNGFVSIYPNPLPGSARSLTLSYAANNNKMAVISMRNIIGQEIFKKNVQLSKGENNIEISLEELNLKEGHYFIQIQTNDDIETKRLMINRQ